MNYYEHHLGDYAEATGHLSFVEDAAYSRMIRKYYASEKPLPADEKAVQRLVGARTKEEREAVATVLQEFFDLRADGWHNTRCDEEIARYKEGDAEREQKSAHEKERMRRHREERSRLFAELREHGITPKWDTPVMQLREILSRVSNAPETRTGVTGNAHATANQTPDTSHQTPDLKNKHTHQNTEPRGVWVGIDDQGEPGPPPQPTAAGTICKALKAAGLANVSPQHPALLALIERGVTAETFADAAATAVSRGKGFDYAIGILRRQLDEAAEIGELPKAQQQPAMHPDSRAAVEAEGEAKGFGRWNETRERWDEYKARVRGLAPKKRLTKAPVMAAPVGAM